MLFYPPEEFLKIMGCNKPEELSKRWFIYPPKTERKIIRHGARAISRFIDDSYSQRAQDSCEVIVLELLKNSRFHGSSKDNQNTTIGLFLTEEAACVGCHDGGDYFKKQQTKEVWEDRQIEPNPHKVENKNIGYRAGQRIIYDVSDKIHIDTEEGIIYLLIKHQKYIYLPL